MNESRSASKFGVVKVGAFLLIALLATSLAFWLFRPGQSAIARIESEHGIQLPASTRSAQAMGDASNPILRAVGLDRGASSIFVIDRADLPAILGQYPDLTDGELLLRGSVAPGNSIYQPSSVPWNPDQDAESTFSTSEPPDGGDFTNIGIYPLDDPDTVGVWIYTDWN